MTPCSTSSWGGNRTKKAMGHYQEEGIGIKGYTSDRGVNTWVKASVHILFWNLHSRGERGRKGRECKSRGERGRNERECKFQDIAHRTFHPRITSPPCSLKECILYLCLYLPPPTIATGAPNLNAFGLRPRSEEEAVSILPCGTDGTRPKAKKGFERCSLLPTNMRERVFFEWR